MKVLLINAFYGKGSTGTIVKDIESLCLKKGIDCYVASPDINVKKAKFGIRIGNSVDHKIHAALCRLFGKQAYFSSKATLSFIEIVKKIKPDVVHLHNIHSNFIDQSLFFSFLADHKIATVLTLHDCWFYTGGCFHYTLHNCYKWKEECGKCPQRYTSIPSLRYRDYTREILQDRIKIYSRIDNLVTVGVSNWISSEAKKSCLRNTLIKTIYNGIDTSIFKPMNSDFLKQIGLENKFVILGPASKWLLPENTEVLQYFINNMKKDEVLLLFGAISQNQTRHPNIYYYDYVSSKEKLAEIYSASDVFVNCSREDSLSLINLEAQACGTPVVTFGITGLSETVDNISSYRVPVGNAKMLYEKVSLIKEKKVKPNKLCRDYILANFKKETNYQRYIGLYYELTK